MSATTAEVTDEDIIKVFRQSEDAFLTATEIAESLGMTRQGINHRLKKLHGSGVLEKKRAGSRAVGWWLSQD